MRNSTVWLKWAIGFVSVVLIAGIAVLVGLTPTHRSLTTPPARISTNLKTDLTPPHFATPQAAMTYLAAAYNANNRIDLNHVTNPAARAQLNNMHSMAVNLKLNHCTRRPEGDYECTFDHQYPSSDTTRGPDPGHAVFLVGPATTSGWYMTVYESCN